jgi:rhodanese-related sulfurtransferase
MPRKFSLRLGMAALPGLIAISFVSLKGCCTPAASQCLSAVNLSAQGAYDLILQYQGDPNLVILDVRTPDEYNTEHIPGAINIDVEDASFQDEVGALDRDKMYLVYCRSGRRSCIATDIMSTMGFSTLYNMVDGINDWKDANLPLEK